MIKKKSLSSVDILKYVPINLKDNIGETTINLNPVKEIIGDGVKEVDESQEISPNPKNYTPKMKRVPTHRSKEDGSSKERKEVFSTKNAHQKIGLNSRKMMMTPNEKLMVEFMESQIQKPQLLNLKVNH